MQRMWSRIRCSDGEPCCPSWTQSQNYIFSSKSHTSFPRNNLSSHTRRGRLIRSLIPVWLLMLPTQAQPWLSHHSSALRLCSSHPILPLPHTYPAPNTHRHPALHTLSIKTDTPALPTDCLGEQTPFLPREHNNTWNELRNP